MLPVLFQSLIEIFLFESHKLPANKIIVAWCYIAEALKIQHFLVEYFELSFET